jgi:ATP-dependent Clp protease ATP-binding subunit ClpA
VLCRRSKNNPLYVGDPASARRPSPKGWPRKIVESDVPEVLEDATIFALDMGALLPAPATAAISKSASSR